MFSNEGKIELTPENIVFVTPNACWYVIVVQLEPNDSLATLRFPTQIMPIASICQPSRINFTIIFVNVFQKKNSLLAVSVNHLYIILNVTQTKTYVFSENYMPPGIAGNRGHIHSGEQVTFLYFGDRILASDLHQ